ncbi:hypothetical protein [Longimicrobium sp.]|uniref:hypothetical protein n=1 Tax=Longimicrobium sp. TaxID=2029185 RepID=UPI002E35BC71|nr:hypothetical protein [Longimicrobium sp.]HEX6037728.1 hypothetical protein [Longimicrobium sp.]
MRKLTLDVDTLQVESFEAAEQTERMGTVHGNAVTPLCTGADSCQELTWCQDTCYCAYTSPRPSCFDCSWDTCATNSPDCA